MTTHIDKENRFHKIEYLHWFQAWCEKRNLDFCYAEKMAEPGYDQTARGVILTNWNNVPEHIAKGLELRGFDTRWLDEWVVVHNANDCCSEAYRSSPDCYSWTPSFVLTDGGELLGLNEAQENPEQYFDLLLNDPDRALTFRGISPEEHGWVQYNPADEVQEYENGFHAGMNDSPATVLEKAQEKYPEHDFMFQISEQSQFYTRFILWMRFALSDNCCVGGEE